MSRLHMTYAIGCTGVDVFCLDVMSAVNILGFTIFMTLLDKSISIRQF